MRLLFLLLVLANLGFFAWSRYFAPADAALDSAPLSRQIEPDKLRIVRPGDTAKPPVKPSAPAAPPVAAAVPPTTGVPAPAAPGPAAPASPVALATLASCLEWGSFTLVDAPKAEKVLEPFVLGGRIVQRRTEEMAGWWVFIPPQNNRQTALKKAAQLKALGVTDYFVVSEEGPFRWALSLGVFRTEDAAKARLLTLADQGVRSARIGPRETMVPKVWLQVRGSDAALEARLKGITRQIEGSELKPCS